MRFLLFWSGSGRLLLLQRLVLLLLLLILVLDNFDLGWFKGGFLQRRCQTDRWWSLRVGTLLRLCSMGVSLGLNPTLWRLLRVENFSFWIPLIATSTGSRRHCPDVRCFLCSFVDFLFYKHRDNALLPLLCICHSALFTSFPFVCGMIIMNFVWFYLVSCVWIEWEVE